MEKVFVGTKKGQVRLAELAGMSLLAFSEVLGIQYKTFFNWRRGTKPNQSTLNAIAEYFHTTNGYENKQPYLAFYNDKEFLRPDSLGQTTNSLGRSNIPKSLNDLIADNYLMATYNLTIEEIAEVFNNTNLIDDIDKITKETWLEIVKSYRFHIKTVKKLLET